MKRIPRQTGPTCWFHALLLHLLTVPSIRRKIATDIVEYRKTLNVQERNAFETFPETCSRFGTVPTRYTLYRYLYHIINETAPNKINSAKLINAALHQYFNHKTQSHRNTMRFLPLLAHRLGIDLKSGKYVVWNTSSNNSTTMLLQSNVPTNAYTFRGHLMSLRGPNRAHAVVGYYMNNKPYIADSRFGTPLPINFTDSNNILNFYKPDGYTKVIYKNALFERK